MTFIVGILTFVMVLNALLLILLVLVQLPKKDAGAGMAFGGGTADALFGSGSGNVLTKITKYATVVFLFLALFLGYLHDRAHADSSAADFAKRVQQKEMQVPVTPPPMVNPAPAAAPATQPPANNLLSTLPVQTNAPAAK
jgi:preprotein translocase subunit SecG